jgi:hypothetical protein
VDSRVALDPVPDPLNTVRILADRVVTLRSDREALAPAGSGLPPNMVPTPVGPVVTHPSGTPIPALVRALVDSGRTSEGIPLSARDPVRDPDLPNTVRILVVPASEELSARRPTDSFPHR